MIGHGTRMHDGCDISSAIPSPGFSWTRDSQAVAAPDDDHPAKTSRRWSRHDNRCTGGAIRGMGNRHGRRAGLSVETGLPVEGRGKEGRAAHEPPPSRRAPFVSMPRLRLPPRRPHRAGLAAHAVDRILDGSIGVTVQCGSVCSIPAGSKGNLARAAWPAGHSVSPSA